MNYLYFAIIMIFILLFFLLLKKETNKFRDIVVIKNYESFIAVLEYYMGKAFDIIYKDQILIYSIEATSPKEEMIEKAMRDHLNLTLKLLGPAMHERYLDFFGSEECFYFNISEYFNNRYESDEIKKASVNNIMEKEISTKTT